MKYKGVNYDIGMQVPYNVPENRNNFLERDSFGENLPIIKNELGCNAIRVTGTVKEELLDCAEKVLQAGLDCWLSPHYIEADLDETEKKVLECAEGLEVLRQKYPDNETVLIYGCEMHHFTDGLIPGANFTERLERLAEPGVVKKAGKLLDEFFARAIPDIRKVFKGRVTYCTVNFETVDWAPFDIICLDHYKSSYNKTTFIDELKPYVKMAAEQNKELVITETGYCCFKGCSDAGAIGFQICHATEDGTLNGTFERAEKEQADAIVDAMQDIEAAGAAGTFVFSFIHNAYPHVEDDPSRDLDMSGYGIVKAYADGRRGKTYPNAAWEPKEAFFAVKEFFAAH